MAPHSFRVRPFPYLAAAGHFRGVQRGSQAASETQFPEMRSCLESQVGFIASLGNEEHGEAPVLVKGARYAWPRSPPTIRIPVAFTISVRKGPVPDFNPSRSLSRLTLPGGCPAVHAKPPGRREGRRFGAVAFSFPARRVLTHACCGARRLRARPP